MSEELYHPPELISSRAHIASMEQYREMYEQTIKALPVDIAVCAAAVTDFRPEKYEKEKIKKNILNINLKQNVDILEFLSKKNSQRPKLVVGFAAETNNILKNAKEKKNRKHCDWIIANDVSKKEIGFSSEYNKVSIIHGNQIEIIKKNLKSNVANKIAKKIIDSFV